MFITKISVLQFCVTILLCLLLLLLYMNIIGWAQDVSISGRSIYIYTHTHIGQKVQPTNH